MHKPNQWLTSLCGGSFFEMLSCVLLLHKMCLSAEGFSNVFTIGSPKNSLFNVSLFILSERRDIIKVHLVVQIRESKSRNAGQFTRLIALVIDTKCRKTIEAVQGTQQLRVDSSSKCFFFFIRLQIVYSYALYITFCCNRLTSHCVCYCLKTPDNWGTQCIWPEPGGHADSLKTEKSSSSSAVQPTTPQHTLTWPATLTSIHMPSRPAPTMLFNQLVRVQQW